MSELAKRVIVAAIGIPLAVLIIFQGGWLFNIFITILSVFGLREYYSLAEKKGTVPNRACGHILNIAISVAVCTFTANGNYPSLKVLIVILMLSGPAVLLAELWRKRGGATHNTAATLAGILYVSTGFISLILLRTRIYDIQWGMNEAMDTEQAALILSVFTAIWICDSAAYFIGRKLGRHKLWERHSPKKSWEGAIGGFVFSIVSMIAAQQYFLRSMNLQDAVVIGALAGVLGQLGDLAESQLKRDAEVKDSGNFFPGHGGILDRFDSLLFTGPAVFAYLFLAS